MEQVSIRPFAPGDTGPLVEVWNRSLPKDPITEERFWELFLLDPNFDPAGALVAEATGRTAGFLQAMARRHPMGPAGLEPSKGYLTVFFVDAEHRRRGIGSRLLETGLTYLRDRGRTEVWCNGYAPIYIFPGVDRDYAEALGFLESHGFQRVAEPVAMGMRLEGVATPDPVRRRYAELREEGFEVRLFRRDDTWPLIAFSERYFPEYGQTVLDGLQRGNLEIVVATLGDEIVGFTQWENTYTDPPAGAPGRFGPFGVRPDLRNKGLGAAIFYFLIERVTGNGARYLWFGWAGGRNLSFYERAGCTITRQFYLYMRGL